MILGVDLRVQLFRWYAESCLECFEFNCSRAPDDLWTRKWSSFEEVPETGKNSPRMLELSLKISLLGLFDVAIPVLFKRRSASDLLSETLCLFLF